MTKKILLFTLIFSLISLPSFAAPVEIELVQYKQEALKIFDELATRFNASHKDIVLKVSSPNEPITILKTRFIRENYPDIIR